MGHNIYFLPSSCCLCFLLFGYRLWTTFITQKRYLFFFMIFGIAGTEYGTSWVPLHLVFSVLVACFMRTEFEPDVRHKVLSKISKAYQYILFIIQKNKCTTYIYIYINVGRDSVVCIVARYGLGGPGDWMPVGNEVFRTRPDRPWNLPNLLYNGYRVLPGGKAAEEWRRPPTPI
jgi:hypothetical protein